MTNIHDTVRELIIKYLVITSSNYKTADRNIVETEPNTTQQKALEISRNEVKGSI